MVGFIPWLQIIALLRRPRIVYDFGCVLLGAFKRLLISRSRLVVTADTVFTVTDIAWASASGPLAGNEGSSTITFGSSFAAGGQLNFDASRSAGIR